jgi:multidrug efflux pump subunit AcrB
MQANNVSADDVLNAISVQNLILPAEDQKIGKFDWNVALNASPILLDKINDLAVKKVNGTIIYVHDVAYVHEGIVAANQHGPRQRHQGRADGDPQGRLRLDPRSQSRRLYAVHFAAKEAQ